MKETDRESTNPYREHQSTERMTNKQTDKDRDIKQNKGLSFYLQCTCTYFFITNMKHDRSQYIVNQANLGLANMLFPFFVIATARKVVYWYDCRYS